MLSTKYFNLFLLFILIFKNFVSAQESHVDLYEIDPIGFLSVVIFAHIFIPLGFIGVLFMLIRIYFSGHLRGYLAINHTAMSGTTCKRYATVTVAFTLFHRLIIASISIITYLRVCRNKVCDTSRYDWKLFLPVAVLSIFTTVSAYDTYGPVIYWCATLPNTIAIPISSICSGVVGNKSTTHSPIDSVEIKVSKKVMGYILVFILQWVPAIPYDICQFFGHAGTWVYCTVIISINIEPIGNAIFYVMNEGWSRYSSEINTSAYDSVNDKSSTKVDSKNSTIPNYDDNMKSIDIKNGSFDIEKN
ncbi:putative g-protein coupled receptor 21 [Gigaspora margarita]|uniref:Putative g-protein coupled receptor 21 n=1 Tax=Gigaspora margarita TaxID=4874 RepID=A0A8H4A1I7_GIGMA|nr:putative g-protein coupled receptor 21 [Gigaspora margarita]